MQNQQMAQMANMNAGGPVTGTPIMGNGQRRPTQNMMEPRDQLNTYIYDYFIRSDQPRLARMMIDSGLKLKLSGTQKVTSGSANTNGVDAMDQDSKEELPAPELPPNQMSENSFLMDWWVQFWDIFSASRGNPNKGAQYTSHVRNLTHMANEARNQRMMMTGVNGVNGLNPQAYNMMRMQQQNGVPGDLKRAMHNRNPQVAAAAMANMNQMQKQHAMMGTQMQREGSQIDGRPQSPGSNENAPSPNKRPRVDGGNMNQPNGPGQFNEFAQNVQQKSIEVYAHSLVEQQRVALNNHAISQGMNAGHQGSPMPQAAGLDGSADMYAGNQPRTGLSNGQPGPPQGNHALQDYQMQLMLLEQQNKKRLLMARQEQDSMTGPHSQGVGGPGFPAAMSPQGSRPGPSPNPADMKKGTPRMGPQGLPAGGSPMPDAMMQNRNSPAPNMQFDPNAPQQAFPQQYPGLPGQMPTTPMMRPNPGSHPNFNGQQMNPQQQMEAMRQNGMPNGAWRGPQGQPGMMPTQQMGPMGNQPPQQRGQMPPPPAPAGEQQRPQVPSPSQPAQAPPTPSQANKANPKKKATKDNKPANKKGANTGATPAASAPEEPATPTTPMHKNFGPNGQQQPPQVATQPQPPAPPQQQQQAPPMDNNTQPPFGNISDEPNFDLDLAFNADPNSLDQFDFESFLHVGDDQNSFGALDFGNGFGDVEAAELN
ncbi:hypothetical protein CC80DRAFT_93127 [Byssothecium circinans]|uniref:LisH domain-containing protein n=1 Tax=Byssothecium circinans TaxID=147558 RepID=A0A6A5TUE8_9PLEO|nr:hypothetical protein CC80DRAFT_93127 [Byssothecium circinans]